MTVGPIPPVKTGDILRYVYLFEREAQAGRDEGAKERPVMVVAVEGNRVFVAPTTTKGGPNGQNWPIPDLMADSVGLDRGSSIVTSEYNMFEWMGFDIRPLLDRPGYVMGRINPGSAATILRQLIANRARGVDRR